MLLKYLIGLFVLHILNTSYHFRRESSGFVLRSFKQQLKTSHFLLCVFSIDRCVGLSVLFLLEGGFFPPHDII